MTKNRIHFIPVFALFFASAVMAWADDIPVPKHLDLGRTLVAALSPENTGYQHKGRVVWKGDFLASQYKAHTDCSGLITSLLERAESPSFIRLKMVARDARPRVEDYYSLISRQDSFKRINVLTEVLPGDIIAVKYPPGEKDTGHVMLVDARPALRKKDTKPVVEGTKQWEVTIIDSSKSPHGKSDTRQNEDGSKRSGVGRGIFRLYSNEHDEPVGHSWSIASSSVFQDSTTRPIVIGRPIPETP
jgi:hypothetical protein